MEGRNVDLFKLFYYRFIKHIKNIVPCVGTHFILHKKSSIYVRGKLILNDNCYGIFGRTTTIRLDKNAKMKVNGDFSVFYGGDIICFENSSLRIGSGFANSNLKIRCKRGITIGNNVAIAHDVTIMDSDGHLVGERCRKEQVKIHDNVWIGSKAVILKGVTIGEGSMIAAGSVVTKSIPSYCMAAGVPARVIKENFIWKL